MWAKSDVELRRIEGALHTVWSKVGRDADTNDAARHLERNAGMGWLQGANVVMAARRARTSGGTTPVFVDRCVRANRIVR